MRIGAKVAVDPKHADASSLADRCRHLENAGFDSLWVSDHLFLPGVTESRYPYSPDGRLAHSPRHPWYDSIVTMTVMASATRNCEIGVAAMVIPLRPPVQLAKQIASLSALCDARIAIGVGTGWLAEEFDVTGIDFNSRGRRADEAIEVMRRCWTGEPTPLDEGTHRIPAGLHIYPVPNYPVQLLAAGMSGPALRRAGRRCDGWLAVSQLDSLDVSLLQDKITRVNEAAQEAGRSDRPRILIRLLAVEGAKDVARVLPTMRDIGFTDAIVDVHADGDETCHAVREMYREALA